MCGPEEEIAGSGIEKGSPETVFRFRASRGGGRSISRQDDAALRTASDTVMRGLQQHERAHGHVEDLDDWLRAQAARWPQRGRCRRRHHEGADPTAWLDALYETGCDDATVGVGKHGSIALDFSREAASAEEAIRSAIGDVQKAIPGAVLTEISSAAQSMLGDAATRLLADIERERVR